MTTNCFVMVIDDEIHWSVFDSKSMIVSRSGYFKHHNFSDRGIEDLNLIYSSFGANHYGSILGKSHRKSDVTVYFIPGDFLEGSWKWVRTKSPYDLRLLRLTQSEGKFGLEPVKRSQRNSSPNRIGWPSPQGPKRFFNFYMPFGPCGATAEIRAKMVGGAIHCQI